MMDLLAMLILVAATNLFSYAFGPGFAFGYYVLALTWCAGRLPHHWLRRTGKRFRT